MSKHRNDNGESKTHFNDGHFEGTTMKLVDCKNKTNKNKTKAAQCYDENTRHNKIHNFSTKAMTANTAL